MLRSFEDRVCVISADCVVLLLTCLKREQTQDPVIHSIAFADLSYVAIVRLVFLVKRRQIAVSMYRDVWFQHQVPTLRASSWNLSW